MSAFRNHLGSFSLRPERALINPNQKMDNLHKGKIEEVIYHGDHTRVRINLLGNPEFILKVPNSSSNLGHQYGVWASRCRETRNQDTQE